MLERGDERADQCQDGKRRNDDGMKWAHDGLKLQDHNWAARPKIYVHHNSVAAGQGVTGEVGEGPRYMLRDR